MRINTDSKKRPLTFLGASSTVAVAVVMLAMTLVSPLSLSSAQAQVRDTDLPIGIPDPDDDDDGVLFDPEEVCNGIQFCIDFLCATGACESDFPPGLDPCRIEPEFPC